MYKKIIIACIIMVWFTQAFAATPDASIASMSGNVKVRYGVGEEWNKASVGLLLRYVDTIITGKDGQVKCLQRTLIPLIIGWQEISATRCQSRCSRLSQTETVKFTETVLK